MNQDLFASMIICLKFRGICHLIICVLIFGLKNLVSTTEFIVEADIHDHTDITKIYTFEVKTNQKSG